MDADSHGFLDSMLHDERMGAHPHYSWEQPIEPNNKQGHSKMIDRRFEYYVNDAE